VKRGIGWPIGIATILAITVGVNIWVAVIANDDPSFSIENDYYRKAVGWDSTMAQMRENARLAWHIEPAFDTFTTRDGAMLHVRLSDAAGAPIRGATVRVAALYNARAGQILEGTMSADTPATYVLHLPVTHPGEWEVRFDIHHGADRYTSSVRLEAVAADGVR
jgi:nitrogen fixation protein FixH